MNMCLQCGKETDNPKFCSRSCSATHANALHPKRKRFSKYCVECGKQLNYHQYKFCSSVCTSTNKKKNTIEKFLNGKLEVIKIPDSVRDFLIEKAKYKCNSCGWSKTNSYTGKIVLDIHHKDGNRKNNSPDNLDVLCPNCHALTDNFKSNNRNRPYKS